MRLSPKFNRSESPVFGLFHGDTLIFDYNFIFTLLECYSTIYLQNCIQHLHIDPGDKIYTLVELRCWKVENLRHYSTISRKQDRRRSHRPYALKTLWVTVEFQTPFKCILVGQMNKMVTVLTFIAQFMLAHGDIALTNAMLKDYNVGNTYEYWFKLEGIFLKD